MIGGGERAAGKQMVLWFDGGGMVCGAVATEAVSLHDNGGTCFVSGSAVPWSDVAAVYLIAVMTGSFIRPGRINERPSIEYTLYDQQRFVEKICVCDPAQADSVTECGSTWPKMALVSHPRLGCVLTAHARARDWVRIWI